MCITETPDKLLRPTPVYIYKRDVPFKKDCFVQNEPPHAVLNIADGIVLNSSSCMTTVKY